MTGGRTGATESGASYRLITVPAARYITAGGVLAFTDRSVIGLAHVLRA